MSSFNEFSKKTNHGDMNRADSKKKSKVAPTDIAKNRIDPNTGNEREDRDDGMERERAGRSLQENSNPISSNNRERSQNRNER